MATRPPRVPGLVDAHCHLDYPPMANDLDATFEAGSAAGVVQYLHIGCTRESMGRAVELAAAHERVFTSIGVHPHEAITLDDDTVRTLEQHAAHPKVLAIGETGLDYYYDRSPRDVQQRALAEHVELARRLDLPLVLHIREAHDDAIAVVTEAGPRAELPGMIHCFTGGPEEGRRWLSLGFHLSFSGIATFKATDEIRAALRLCPADRILLETDAPFLAPEPVRGRKNQPANVAFTCVRLAHERRIPPEALAVTAAENTRALLRMPPPPEAAGA